MTFVDIDRSDPAVPVVTLDRPDRRNALGTALVGTCYFLPRIVGATRAAELMLTGRHFSAEVAASRCWARSPGTWSRP